MAERTCDFWGGRLARCDALSLDVSGLLLKGRMRYYGRPCCVERSGEARGHAWGPLFPTREEVGHCETEHLHPSVIAS